MPLLHIVILALIQGITEFLPVSSSGHLVLTHKILGTQGWDQDLTMDIAVHIGTLFAVLFFFRRDIAALLRAKNIKVPANIIIASLPVIVAGYVINGAAPEWLRTIPVIGWGFVVFGVVLWVADRFFPQEKAMENLSMRQAFFIGLAQALALIPGISRSGITMTAGRFLSLNRTESARFSLFLAIVAISGAGALGGIDLLHSGNVTLGLDALIAAFISFASSFLAIALMMRWLTRATFTPFVIYRIIFGAVLLALFYSGFIGA